MRLFVYFAVLIALSVPLGAYIARVFKGESKFADRVFGPLERLLYRFAWVDPADDMSWQRYLAALLVFNIAGILVVYGLQRLQAVLPLNPAGFGAVDPFVSWNTAVSFASNTNWQAYAGESTMSHLNQMFALTVQNFVSAATGIAVVFALARGFVRGTAKGIGNFWVDLVRTTLHVLLPLSLVLSVLLVSQGVVQTFQSEAHLALTDPQVDSKGTKVTEQVISLGPVASQVAIKQLGTNGGGYYDATRHSIENPTPFSNFLEVIAILLIPAALCFTFGSIVSDRRQGVTLRRDARHPSSLMGHTVSLEQAGNPVLSPLGVDASRSALQPGGNMEGKEARFGPIDLGIWATATTAASNGSVNAMHDSFMPLAGMWPCSSSSWARWCLPGLGPASTACFSSPSWRTSRGPHGGPHARIPGEEDRILRGEDG